MNPSDFLPLLSVVLSVATVVGGLFAFKRGRNKEAQEIESRVITALEKEVKVQRDRIEDLEHKIEALERERTTQDSVISAIRHLLGQQGLRIIISGKYVTLENSDGKSSKITRIRDQTKLKPIDDEEIG